MAQTPTIVQTLDGQVVIPAGEPGTYKWVRQASLIAVAYRAAQDFRSADIWQREYTRRLALWQQVQVGADFADIAATSSPDLLAPVRIVTDVVSSALTGLGDVAEAIGDAAKNTAGVIPLAVIGVLVVLIVLANRSSVRL